MSLLHHALQGACTSIGHGDLDPVAATKQRSFASSASRRKAIGEYLNQKAVASAFLIAPNYAAGKDVLAGLKATFKGSVSGEEYTKWPDQLDFSVELAKARAAKPDAVFAFYPGAAGIQFLTQYAQAGLKAQLPLYTAFVIDALSLPKLNELALGVPGAQHWVNDLPNEANKRFVADFRAKYRRYPSFYAAQAYDSAKLIDSAVAAVNGELGNKGAIRDAMRKANYASVRGPYRYGNNHFPIQNFYLQEAVRDVEGTYTLNTVATVLKDHQDRYHDQCPDGNRSILEIRLITGEWLVFDGDAKRFSVG